MAIEAGAAGAAAGGLLVRQVVIPGVSPQVLRHIL
jgi:microcompartment protein CcmL/EutN